VDNGSVNVAAVDENIVATMFYWALNGTANWHPERLPGITGGAPGITTYAGGVHVVDRDWFGQLADKSTANGTSTWLWTGVGPKVSESDPAVTMNDGIENIAEIDDNGNLDFYWQASDGTYIQEVVDTAANL
jgi:hypothetical protein